MSNPFVKLREIARRSQLEASLCPLTPTRRVPTILHGSRS